MAASVSWRSNSFARICTSSLSRSGSLPDRDRAARIAGMGSASPYPLRRRHCRISALLEVGIGELGVEKLDFLTPREAREQHGQRKAA